jgi:hypothetical protein
MDPNLPQAYGVYDSKAKKTIATFQTAREATTHCEQLEPESWTRYRYTVRPIRRSEHTNGDRTNGA